MKMQTPRAMIADLVARGAFAFSVIVILFIVLAT